MTAIDAPDADTIWDFRYNSRRGRVISTDNDPWLERWESILETARRGNVLELGCGSGRDSRYLTGMGLNLIASDYSPAALEVCRRHAPQADVRLLDIRSPLPFHDGAFRIVMASLCLHYFPWTQTTDIMTEIRRCLAPGGFLLVRLNSTGDIHYGAAGYPEVEPNLYRVDGELKRFFDQDAVEHLIDPEWEVLSLEEKTIKRYESPKAVWEVVLKKQ